MKQQHLQMLYILKFKGYYMVDFAHTSIFTYHKYALFTHVFYVYALFLYLIFLRYL